MATKTNVMLVDDLTNEPADTTVLFGLDGVEYSIDLTKQNAEELREMLDTYTHAGRKVGGAQKTTGRRTGPSTQTDVSPAAVRAWAEANGIPVNKRGRIKADVVAQFRAAGN